MSLPAPVAAIGTAALGDPMDKRVLVVLALAASVLAALLVFALMPQTTVITPSRPMPEVVVAGSTATAGVAAPAEAPAEAPPVPGHRGKIPTGDADQIVELPPGARVEDGGLAFGDAVCKHITSCGCQERSPVGCAKAYASFTAENYETAKCLIDLPCPELCEALANPGKTTSSCARAVNDITASRFRDHGK